MAKKSVSGLLDDMLAQFADDVDRIDESTKKIEELSNRIEYNFKKARDVSEKTNIPLPKFKKVGEFAQCVVDACSSFASIDRANEGGDDAGPTDDAAGSFEEFTSSVEEQLAKCEKEITNLSMLEGITKSIVEQ